MEALPGRLFSVKLGDTGALWRATHVADAAAPSGATAVCAADAADSNASHASGAADATSAADANSPDAADAADSAHAAYAADAADAAHTTRREDVRIAADADDVTDATDHTQTIVNAGAGAYGPNAADVAPTIVGGRMGSSRDAGAGSVVVANATAAAHLALGFTWISLHQLAIWCVIFGHGNK